MSLPERSDFMPLVIRVHNNLIVGFEKMANIHLARWRLLFMIGRVGSCSQTYLTRETTIGPAAVTRILKDMERQGLVTRQSSTTDSRQVIVKLTEKGRATVRKTAKTRKEFLRVALDGLSPAEIAQLERLMKHVEQNLANLR